MLLLRPLYLGRSWSFPWHRIFFTRFFAIATGAKKLEPVYPQESTSFGWNAQSFWIIISDFWLHKVKMLVNCVKLNTPMHGLVFYIVITLWNVRRLLEYEMKIGINFLAHKSRRKGSSVKYHIYMTIPQIRPQNFKQCYRPRFWWNSRHSLSGGKLTTDRHLYLFIKY